MVTVWLSFVSLLSWSPVLIHATEKPSWGPGAMVHMQPTIPMLTYKVVRRSWA